VVSAPLKSVSFKPDLVMIYCDSEQINLLLLAREYKEGYNLKCALSSHAACVYAVVPAITTGKCQVAIPCRGDRWVAMAESDELIFSVPLERLEDLITGLRHVEKTGSKLPHGRAIQPESEMSEEYKKIANMMKYLKPYLLPSLTMSFFYLAACSYPRSNPHHGSPPEAHQSSDRGHAAS